MVLREFLVKLGLDVNEQSFAKGVVAGNLLTAALSKVVEVGKEFAAAFVENIKHSIEYGDKTLKASQSIGIATAALQELQYAGTLADVSTEGMATSIGILSKKMFAAKQGSEEAGKAFKGIKFQEGGKLKATDEVLASIADKFQSMPDGAEKTAMAMELFGRSGKQMIPLLNKGSEELEAMRKEAQELGLVMGDDALHASEELNDNLKRLSEITTGLWRGAIAPLLPAINNLVKRFLDWKKANSEVIRQKLQQYIGYVIKAIGFLSGALEIVTENFTIIKYALAGLVIAFGLLNTAAVTAAVSAGAAWLLAAAPFIGLAALIAGVMIVLNSLRRYANGEDSVFNDYEEALSKWLSKKQDWWLLDAFREIIKLADQFIEKVSYLFGAFDAFKSLFGDRSTDTVNKFKANHAEQFNTAGQYVGSGGYQRLGMSTVGQRTGAAITRRSGGVQMANGEQFGPQLPPAMAVPELRAPAANKTITIAPAINIGPVTQLPGESMDMFTMKIKQLALETVDYFWAGKMQAADSGTGQ